MGVTLVFSKVSGFCELEENNSSKGTVTKSSSVAVTTNDERNILAVKVNIASIKSQEGGLQKMLKS